MYMLHEVHALRIWSASIACIKIYSIELAHGWDDINIQMIFRLSYWARAQGPIVALVKYMNATNW